MPAATVELHFVDADAERRFLESYLADAWSRFDSSDSWERGWFWSYGQFVDRGTGLDGGLVRLVFDGDVETVVETESDRWETFEGLESWECRRYDDPDAFDEAATYESLLAQQRDAKGAVGGDREYRYKPLTSRFALEYRREFDDPLPAAPHPTDDDPAGIGVWSLMHSLFVQCGYDWHDETDACLRAMQNRTKSIAHYCGEEAARAEYERVRDAWDAYEEELDEWLATNSTGGGSEP